jgi:hypothetical protein
MWQTIKHLQGWLLAAGLVSAMAQARSSERVSANRIGPRVDSVERN